MKENNKISCDTKKMPDINSSADEMAAQYKRIAKRILKLIIKSIPSLVPSLKINKTTIMVNNEVKMPLLTEYEGSVIPSYIIVKGDKERTLYFCIMKEQLYTAIKETLTSNIELRDALTRYTVRIQFACPDIGYGLYFKKKSQGMLKGKKTHIFQFTLNDSALEK